jgi:hypothetical protein
MNALMHHCIIDDKVPAEIRVALFLRENLAVWRGIPIRCGLTIAPCLRVTSSNPVDVGLQGEPFERANERHREHKPHRGGACGSFDCGVDVFQVHVSELVWNNAGAFSIL